MDEFRTLSGRDQLQAMIDGRIDPPPMALLMKFRLVEAGDGRAVFHGPPTSDVINPMGAVHGGWYGAVLDSALGCAVHSTLLPGEAYTTLEYKVNITRAVPIGREVETISTVQHRGQRTAVATAEMRGVEDGRIYATGSATCMILRA